MSGWAQPQTAVAGTVQHLFISSKAPRHAFQERGQGPDGPRPCKPRSPAAVILLRLDVLRTIPGQGRLGRRLFQERALDETGGDADAVDDRVESCHVGAPVGSSFFFPIPSTLLRRLRHECGRSFATSKQDACVKGPMRFRQQEIPHARRGQTNSARTRRSVEFERAGSGPEPRFQRARMPEFLGGAGESSIRRSEKTPRAMRLAGDCYRGAGPFVRFAFERRPAAARSACTPPGRHETLVVRSRYKRPVTKVFAASHPPPPPPPHLVHRPRKWKFVVFRSRPRPMKKTASSPNGLCRANLCGSRGGAATCSINSTKLLGGQHLTHSCGATAEIATQATLQFLHVVSGKSRRRRATPPQWRGVWAVRTAGRPKASRSRNRFAATETRGRKCTAVPLR